MENTATRLKEIMIERHLTQMELVELCQPYCQKYNLKLTKSELCRYLKGEYKPKQYKLTILGLALNVSESWLMGYDVPKTRLKEIENDKLIEMITLLDDYDRGQIAARVEIMLENEKYTKKGSSSKVA